MDLHESVLSFLLSEMQFMPFEQAAQTIKYRFANPSAHWRLPLYACQAVGGTERQAIPAIAALIALQTAILLVDDLLDNDGRREALGLSVGETANLASVFQAVGIECISRNLTAADQQMRIVNQINHMLVETAYGQYLDAQIPDTEAAYWRAARAKSCPFFGLAFYLGAVAGDAPTETAAGMLELGRLYGEMIQIHDDLGDSLSASGGSDWIQKRTTLPILFARIVDHPEHDRFMLLLENTDSLEAVREAQEILLRCGAVSFCLDQLVQRNQTAKRLLAGLNLPDSQPLEQLFAAVLEPVWKLLEIQA